MRRSYSQALIFGFVASAFAMLCSCVSVSSSRPAAVQPGGAQGTMVQHPAPSQDAAAPNGGTTASVVPKEDFLAEMDTLLQKAVEASDSNHLAEAIRSYVAVLALADQTRSPEGQIRADRATAELSRIGQTLSLEPGSEWVDANGTQIGASTRSAGRADGRSPSVYLYENFGTGKSPIGDAPIHFQFIKNSGSIVSTVSTDAFGKANTTLASLGDPGSEAVIRAFPVFVARGKTYSFSNVFRDFVYLPPANVARVFAMASSELGNDDNPQILDVAIKALKPSGLQLAPFDGALDTDAFRRAFGGDTKALTALGVGAEVPYAAFISVEIAPARQIVLDGVAYNIFTALADVTFRLMRSDGTVVMALPLAPIKGQGGTKESAIADAYLRASDALASALEERMPGIRDTIAKD
ncbi:MAG: hypothetical protein ACLQMF_10955 [Rectinemataceae bacterium]